MNRRCFLMALLASAAIAGSAGAGIWAFMRQTRFGALPSAQNMERILASPHFIDGEFRNLVPGDILQSNGNMVMALLKFLLAKKPDNLRPAFPLPVRTDGLAKLAQSDRDALIWFGHSSFLLQLNGCRILIDPVFSQYASPVSFSNRAFALSHNHQVQELPDIDYLLVSHDHWDHLDWPTIEQLRGKCSHAVCGLGTGAHFRRWSFPKPVHELDWDECFCGRANLEIHFVSSRHFSGRTLTRNKSLWGGFVIKTPQRSVYFSGDGGYGPHFKDIGRRFPHIDLALLDCGQYNERWKHVHLFPEEAAQACVDLAARNLLPAHICKFALSIHAWQEPLERIAKACLSAPFNLITPMIGQYVELDEPINCSEQWWLRQKS